MRYIYHISDIHIFSANHNTIRYAFHRLMIDIKKGDPGDSLLLIAGDIFDKGNTPNTFDIELYFDIIRMVREAGIRTLIIPGNHDYSKNSKEVKNILSILTFNEWQEKPLGGSVICLSTTQMYEIDDVEFYIFSPIDKLTPDLSNTNKIKIAVLHEPMNAAYIDNGQVISTGRFNTSDFTGYDFVMLGDIHKPQFLTPRIAYSGSFVQKDKGEGLDHGYILWDLATMKGEHVFIPLVEVYLKLEARENYCDLPELLKSQKIRYISLIHEKCDTDYLEKLKDEIFDKYKINYINKIVDKNNYMTDLVKLDGKIEKGNPELDINVRALVASSLEDLILKTGKIDEGIAHDVMKYHESLYGKQDIVNYSNYSINYLYWSNILCYKEDNWIDFRNFNNDIVLISGPNKVGKSTLIDILLRAIFNENCRGNKEEFVNKRKKSGVIKLSFNIGIDEYVIERMIYTTSSTCKIYKNGKCEELGGVINITNYIKKKLGIGEYKYFVNMTTALQNRKFLVDLSNADLSELFTTIFELDNLGKMEKEAIKSKNQAIGAEDEIIKQLESLKLGVTEPDLIKNKQEHDNLLKEFNTIEEDLKTVQNKLNCLNKNYTPMDKIKSDNIEELLNKYSKYKDLVIDTKIDTQKLSDEINRLNILLGEYRSRIPKDYSHNKNTTIISREEYKNNTTEIDRLKKITHKPEKVFDESDYDNCKQYIDTHTIHDLGPLKEKLHSQKVKFHEGISSLFTSEMEKELQELKSKIYKKELPSNYDKEHLKSIAQLSLESNDILLQQVNHKITSRMDVTPNSYISEYEVYKEFVDNDKSQRYSEIKSEISKLEDALHTYNTYYSNLRFDDSCQCCSANKSNLENYDLNKITARLYTLNEEYKTKEEYKEKILLYQQRIKAIEEHKTAVKHNDLFEQNQKIKEIINARKDLDRIENIENWNRIDYLEKVKDNSIIENNNKIRKQINELTEQNRKFDAHKKLYDNIQNQRNWSKLEGLRLANAALEYHEYVIVKKTIEKKKSELENYEGKKIYDEYKQLRITKERNLEIEKQVSLHKELVTKIEKERIKNLEERQALQRRIIAAENNKILISKLEDDLKEASYRARTSSIYYNIINKKTGIPSVILTNICPIVKKRVNNVLTQITDFEIDMKYDAKGFHIYTIEGDKRIHADMASGFQKFIIDIIMRAVLTNLSSAGNPNLIFIDEGFGCLDQENFIEVARNLSKLKNNFSAMMIITHMNELSGYADKRIDIKKTGEFSQLQYGTLTKEEKTLQITKDICDDNKQITKQKNQSKEIKKSSSEVTNEDIKKWEPILIKKHKDTYECLACKKENKLSNASIRAHLKGIKARLAHTTFYENNTTILH